MYLTIFCFVFVFVFLMVSCCLLGVGVEPGIYVCTVEGKLKSGEVIIADTVRFQRV